MGSIYSITSCWAVSICFIMPYFVDALPPKLDENFYKLENISEIPSEMKHIFRESSVTKIIGDPIFQPFYISLPSNKKSLELKICRDSNVLCSAEDQTMTFCYSGLFAEEGVRNVCPDDMCFVSVEFSRSQIVLQNEIKNVIEFDLIDTRCVSLSLESVTYQTREMGKLYNHTESKFTWSVHQNKKSQCSVDLMHTYGGQIYLWAAVKRPIDQVCQPYLLVTEVNSIIIPERLRPISTTTSLPEDTVTEELTTDFTTMNTMAALTKHWWIFLILFFLMGIMFVAIFVGRKWQWIRDKCYNSNYMKESAVLPLDYDLPSEFGRLSRQSGEVGNAAVRFDNVLPVQKQSTSIQKEIIRVPKNTSVKKSTTTTNTKSKSRVDAPKINEPIVQRIETKSTMGAPAVNSKKSDVQIVSTTPVKPQLPLGSPIKSLPLLENEMTPDELEYLAFSTVSMGKRYRIFRAAVRTAEQTAEKHGFYIAGREPTVNDEEEEWFRNDADSLIKTCIEQHGEPLPQIGDTHNEHLEYIATHSLREIYQVSLYVELEDSTRMYFLNAVVERFKELIKKFPLEELKKGRHPMKLLVHVYQAHPDVFGVKIYRSSKQEY